MAEAENASELKYLCRKLNRNSRNDAVLKVVDALEARLVDEMSAGWGWPKVYRPHEGLLDLAEKVAKNHPENPDIQVIVAELVPRVREQIRLEEAEKAVHTASLRAVHAAEIVHAEAPEAVHAEAPVHAGEDGVNSDEARKAYRREWMKRRRAESRGLTAPTT